MPTIITWEYAGGDEGSLGQANLKNMMIWHTVGKALECKDVPVRQILDEFRALGGIRGRSAHRGSAPPTYTFRVSP